MEIAQKKYSNRTRFEFDEQSLKYTLSDRGGSRSFRVEYGSIGAEHGEFEERNEWYRNVGAIWLLIGVIVVGSRYLETRDIGGSLWLMLGIVCLAVYWIARTRYTTIDTPGGRVFVIAGSGHDEILGEIDKRRKQQLMSWYGAIDYQNDMGKELGKFRWLLEQDVITRSAYEESAARIRQYHELMQQDTASPYTIN